MTLGERIRQLRKNLNYSQEYVAEQLDVSRQAVSKWEQDLSKPDTNNLIRLSVLLKTTVEYLSTGLEPMCQLGNRTRKKRTKKAVCKITITSIVLTLLILICSIVGYIYTRPVSWDAGVCGGGFVTWIFDKYSTELTETFLNGMGENKENVVNIKAIRGTQEAQWEDDEIYLQFDVEYEHKNEGVVRQTLHFIGKRIWLETYRWSGAIIEG